MAHLPRVTLTVHFIRHGRTEMNRLGLLQGQSGRGLLPEGFRQAERAAEALAGRGISLVYSSDLERALETARVIRERLALRPPIRLSRALREFDYGRMTGLPEVEVRRRYPLFRKDARFRFPGGESHALVQARALGWLARLLRRRPGRAVAVVTHGGWLRTLFSGLRGVPLDDCLEGTVAHGLAGTLEVSRDRGFHLEVQPGVTIFQK
jgi:broad specificity phosphatase PhoE